MANFPVIHRITVFSGVSNTVPLFTVASRPNVILGEATSTPFAWWDGRYRLWQDLAKTTPPVVLTDRVRAWQEDVFTLTQASGDVADVPFYSPAGMAQPSVNFNARPWMVSLEAGLADRLNGVNTPFSVIAVCTPTAGADRHLFCFSNSAVNEGRHSVGVYLDGAVTKWRTLRRRDGTVFDEQVVSSVVVPGVATILSHIFYGTTISQWINGRVDVDNAPLVAGGTLTLHQLILGALNGSGGNSWTGFVSHFLIFDHAISDGTRRYYEALLGALHPSTGVLGTAYPYLFPPNLTPRRIQVPECTGDPGQLRFRVLDKRVAPGDQQDRVLTRLLGDSEGRLATRNSLAAYDVSDDDGASYQREFTGRVHEVSLVDKNTLAFNVDDPSVDALFEIFDGTVPTVPWAMEPVFSPMGLLSPAGGVRYGPHAMVLPMRGKVRIDAGIPAYIEPTWQSDLPGPFDWLRPVRDEFLVITDALQEAASYTAPNGDYALGRHAPDLGVAFRPTGSVEYLHFSAAVIYNPIVLGQTIIDGYAIRGDGENRLAAVGIIDLTAEVALPADGTTGDFYIYGKAPPKPSAPLHIGYTVPGVSVTASGIHWAVLVSGIAHGAFGGRGLTIDYPRFNEIIQDETQLKFRFRVMEGPVDALAWMAENVWPVVGFAPGVTGSGGLFPVSYDPPAVLPSFVLDASNVEEASWSQGRTGQVNYVRIDTVRERQDDPKGAEASSATDMLHEFDGDRIEATRDLDAKRRAFQITARGVRRADGGDGPDKSRQYMMARAGSILDRFEDGPQTLTVVARREPATKGALVGDHAITAIPWVPDLETRRRGGTRVMLITSKGVLPDGRYSFELLDNGPSQFVDAPTLDGLALNPANPRHIVDATVTPPGEGDRAVLELATTLSGVAAPAQGSELWMYAVSVSGVAQQVVAIPNLASRRGHHFRAIGRGAGKLPSAYSSGLSIITAAITPPNSVVATTSGQGVLMTWANGDASYPIMPLLSLSSGVAPVSGFLTQPLPPGSTRFLFTEAGPEGSVRVGVKHVDDFGGDSLVAEAAGTIGPPGTLSAPVGLTILQGRSENDPGSPRELWAGIGVELQWSITEPYANTVLHYAPTSSFSAPPPAHAHAISGIAGDRWRVRLPWSDTTWYFRAFHQRNQFGTSVATEVVSAKPVPLRSGPIVNDSFAGGYAFLSADEAKKVFLNVGSADPDSDRFYYEVNVTGAVEPTIASPFIPRSLFPYSADTGLILEQAAYLWGKFWNQTKGFGQGVKHAIGSATGLPIVVTLALQEVLDLGRKVQVSATFSGAAFWRTWEFDSPTVWPTNNGTETGAPDDTYQRYRDAVEKPSYRRTIPDNTTRNVVAQAFTAANVGGPRVTRSITVGGGLPGSEDGVIYGFAYIPGDDYLTLEWYFNEPIETPVPDPRWSLKVYQGFQGMDTLVATRDPRTEPGGGMGTAYQGGFRDVTFAYNLDGTFCQIVYRFVLHDNQAVYPDVEYQLPVSDFFDVSL